MGSFPFHYGAWPQQPRGVITAWEHSTGMTDILTHQDPQHGTFSGLCRSIQHHFSLRFVGRLLSWGTLMPAHFFKSLLHKEQRPWVDKKHLIDIQGQEATGWKLHWFPPKLSLSDLPLLFRCCGGKGADVLLALGWGVMSIELGSNAKHNPSDKGKSFNGHSLNYNNLEEEQVKDNSGKHNKVTSRILSLASLLVHWHSKGLERKANIYQYFPHQF